MDHPLIQSNPTVMMGKPVIVGTRITIESILMRMAAGETIEQLLAAHPRLTLEANDRQAVLVTIDKDFGELVFRLNRIAAGVDSLN